MTALVPTRVVYGSSILTGVMGYLIGLGANPWLGLLMLPAIFGSVYANRVDR